MAIRNVGHGFNRPLAKTPAATLAKSGIVVVFMDVFQSCKQRVASNLLLKIMALILSQVIYKPIKNVFLG
ncbi:MAG: hypothetical protein ABI413_15530, partial [Ktedonobacteraceae bacterium]